MAPRIAQKGALLEVQGVQNSSFELQSVLFVVLVEEKAVSMRYQFFVRIPLSLCLSRKKKPSLSLGQGRERGQSPNN